MWTNFTLQLRRSQLFVPGNDERKVKKALDLLSCDSIIFDLEDAVPPDQKQSAREIIASAVDKISASTIGKRREFCVRVNPSDSIFHSEDIEFFKNVKAITSIVIPKSETKYVREVHSMLPRKNLIPIIESAKGFLELEDISKSEGVVAVSFGAADFANSVGGRVEEYTGNLYVKTHVGIVARAYGIDPLDNVYFRISDTEGFRKEAENSRNLGYVGKQVVHPSQVDIANEVFSPSLEEIAQARKIIEVYERSLREEGKGALRLDEQLVDAVHYRRAKQVLEMSTAIEESVRQP